MKKVESVAHIESREFEKVFLSKKPLIVKGGIKKTEHFKKWSPVYLQSKIKGKMIKVNTSKSGFFDHSNKEVFEEITLPFNNAVDYFLEGDGTGRAFYIQQTSILDEFSMLLEDLEFPNLIKETDQFHAANLWFGTSGCVTPLHVDRNQNFLHQITGRKEFTLFSPHNTPYLYPKQGYSRYSRINLDQVDSQEFPLFKNATGYKCILEPGDLFYLPPGWWHQVRSLDISISVNFWWDLFDILEGVGLEYAEVNYIVKSIQSFIDKGLSIEHKDAEGELLFIKAVHKGYVNAVKAFLLLGADPNSKSVFYQPGASALLLATEGENQEIIRLLLSHGAHDEENMAYDFAQICGNNEIASLFKSST